MHKSIKHTYTGLKIITFLAIIIFVGFIVINVNSADNSFEKSNSIQIEISDLIYNFEDYISKSNLEEFDTTSSVKYAKDMRENAKNELKLISEKLEELKLEKNNIKDEEIKEKIFNSINFYEEYIDILTDYLEYHEKYTDFLGEFFEFVNNFEDGNAYLTESSNYVVSDDLTKATIACNNAVSSLESSKSNLIKADLILNFKFNEDYKISTNHYITHAKMYSDYIDLLDDNNYNQAEKKYEDVDKYYNLYYEKLPLDSEVSEEDDEWRYENLVIKFDEALNKLEKAEKLFDDANILYNEKFI